MSLDEFITKFGGWTESYWFYSGEIELRYDPKQHVYYLVTGDDLEAQDGVTTICHIIDKSDALIPWAVKMMAVKLLKEAPIMTMPDGRRILGHMTLEDFESLVLSGKNAHKEKLEDAGEVGHTAHAWIEEYIKSILAQDEDRKMALLAKFPEDPRASNCCYAALDWMTRHNVRWLGTERKIYSRKYKYAGTMDGICVVDACHDTKCCPNVFRDRLTIADWKTSNYLYMEYLLQTSAYMQAYNEESLYSDPTSAPALDRWVIRLGKDDGEFETWHAPVETFVEDFNAFCTALTLKRSVESIKARIKAKADTARAIVKAERKAAKESAEAAEKERKALEKAEKKAAKEAALKLKCKKADKYQGKRKPTCGCEACYVKYIRVQESNGSNPIQCPCGCDVAIGQPLSGPDERGVYQIEPIPVEFITDFARNGHQTSSANV